MGEFEDCIGEVPGRSSSLFALYTDLSKMETKLELTGVHLRHLPSKADSWRGAAANAFEVALKNEVKQAQRLESGADKAADAILKYAHAMQSTEKKISSARAQMRALDRQVDAVADDEREKKVDELTPRAQSIARGAKQAINDLHSAGEVCAAELRAALHLEAVEPNKEGNNKGELHVLDRRDVDRAVRGGYPVDSPNATDRPAELSVCSDLQAGEALTHPGVGTFTLLYVNPIVIPFESGNGPIATLEFAPAPGFDTYWDQEKERQ